MSELIDNSASRIDALNEFSRRFIEGGNGKMLLGEFNHYIESVSPQEAMQVLDNLLLTGYSTEKVKACTGKIINVFYNSLKDHQWDKPEESHFLYYLMLENREVEKVMTELKSVTKVFYRGKNQDFQLLTKKLGLLIKKLKDYELHYLKKENILFPYFALRNEFGEYKVTIEVSQDATDVRHLQGERRLLDWNI